MNITHILELLKELEALLKKYGDQFIVCITEQKSQIPKRFTSQIYYHFYKGFL